MSEGEIRDLKEPVKIRAKSLNDLMVMSSVCQDALMSLADIQFDPENKQFLAVINRFCWEYDKDAEGGYFRRHAGLRFDGVESLSAKAINKKQSDTILSLLAIAYLSDEEDAQEGAGFIHLQFSNDRALRLKVSQISAALEDLGEAWHTSWKPEHKPD